MHSTILGVWGGSELPGGLWESPGGPVRPRVGPASLMGGPLWASKNVHFLGEDEFANGIRKNIFVFF